MKDAGDTLYQMLFITLSAVVGIALLKLIASRWSFPGDNIIALI